jgi:hypothetical protein
MSGSSRIALNTKRSLRRANSWHGGKSIFSQEGFQTTYRPFLDLYVLPQFHGSVLALLGMDVPSLQKGHIVAVDELGVVDCANNAPDHVDVAG